MCPPSPVDGWEGSSWWPVWQAPNTFLRVTFMDPTELDEGGGRGSYTKERRKGLGSLSYLSLPFRLSAGPRAQIPGVVLASLEAEPVSSADLNSSNLPLQPDQGADALCPYTGGLLLVLPGSTHLSL